MVNSTFLLIETPSLRLCVICRSERYAFHFVAVLTQSGVTEFILSGQIPGIGRVTERLLDSIDVKVWTSGHTALFYCIDPLPKTCGDIHKHRATLSVLDKQFHLHSLLLTHLGIASNDVRPSQRDERKSVGSER